MLKKLRRNLMFTCMVMTSTVFIVLIGVNCYQTILQYRQMNQQAFEALVDTISEKLTAKPSVTDAWLAEVETANHCLISVTNNGTALFFQGAWIPKTDRMQLISQTNALALSAMVDVHSPPTSWEPTVVEFPVKGESKDSYRASVTVFPPRNERWLGLTILQSNEGERWYIERLVQGYVGISALAVTMLLFVSWWFSGRAVRPTIQSFEKQKTFIASASHELRAPLAVIKTSASAIRVAPDQTDSMLDSIEGECSFLSNLVDDLLLIANMDTGRWKINNCRVDMDTILIELVDKLEPVVRAQGYCLQLDMPEDSLPEISGDAERLTQMFTILIDNAVVHSEHPGEIILSPQVSGRFLNIGVIDHGCGIQTSLREKVFDRFFSANPLNKERKNFGLGLSIAKELVTLHGGTIFVSETSGGGCTFTVRLPIP